MSYRAIGIFHVIGKHIFGLYLLEMVLFLGVFLNQSSFPYF